MTQAVLADRAGVSTALVAAIENGTRTMSSEVRERLVAHLGESTGGSAPPPRTQRERRPKPRRRDDRDLVRFDSIKLVRELPADRTLELPDRGWGALPNFGWGQQPGRDTVLLDHGVPAWRVVADDLDDGDDWARVAIEPPKTRLALLPATAWLARYGINDNTTLATVTGIPDQDVGAVYDGTASGLHSFAAAIARSLRFPIEELVCPLDALLYVTDPDGDVSAYNDAQPQPLRSLQHLAAADLAAGLHRVPLHSDKVRKTAGGLDTSDLADNIERISQRPLRVTLARFGLIERELTHSLGQLPFNGRPGVASIARHFNVATRELARRSPEKAIDWWNTSWLAMRPDDPAELQEASSRGGPLRDRFELTIAARHTLDRYRTWLFGRMGENLLDSAALAAATGIPIADADAIDTWLASPTWLYIEALHRAGCSPITMVIPPHYHPDPRTVDAAAVAQATDASQDRYYQGMSALEFHALVLCCTTDDLDAIAGGRASSTPELDRRVSLTFPRVATVKVDGERRPTRRFTLGTEQ